MRNVDLEVIITEMLSAHPRISDLNFTVGRPCQIAADGLLHAINLDLASRELSSYQTEQVALALINNNTRLLADLIRQGSCDFSYYLAHGPRFRVNIFRQMGKISIVMRRLEGQPPKIKELDLPKCFYKMAREKNGIIFFTGPTGTGKSTSLSAILEDINERESAHIVTLEDPIEYVHSHKKATFNQRELGTDFDSFAHALRASLRQAPNVILVGEIRDRDTMEIALNAAETGHLVLTTLHTMSAGHSINRMLGFYKVEEESQIRFRIADSVRWIVGQRLLPMIQPGRVAIFEIMQNNVRVKDAILHGETEDRTFYEIIDGAKAFDMQTFDQNIIEFFQKRLITEETAIAYASSRAKVRQGIDIIKSAKGEKTSDIDGLSMDIDWQTAKE